MKNLYFIYIALAASLFTTPICGQTAEGISIEGTIVEQATGMPIPFAHVVNVSTNKITISSANGYFRLQLRSVNDTVTVSFLGFKTQQVLFQPNKLVYKIVLQEEKLLLNEVDVVAKDNSYLFDLLVIARRKASTAKETSKAYYNLKSTVDGKQVEMVEGFNNMNVEGYELKSLDLKAGRLALQPFGKRFFTSLESSEAIARQKIFINSYFPTSPLNVSKGKMKKYFYLTLDQKYQDENADSIYVIRYEPKDTSGAFFEGKVWLNTTKSAFLKMTLLCSDCQQHPFLPLFSTDEIKSVNFNITKTFAEINNHFVFSQIDFIYQIDYEPAKNHGGRNGYRVETNAILYGYDFNDQFFIPRFNFPAEMSDYAKINALPVNTFFWAKNNEYRVKDEQNSNETFFLAKESITNENLSDKNKYLNSQFSEFQFLTWSNKRIVFNKRSNNASAHKQTNEEVTVGQYNLSVKIFMDVNIYNDSSDIITETILDPYESFYNGPKNARAYCFINMYFDLCEIERRKFAKQIEAYHKNIPALNRLYNKLLDDIEAMKYAFEMGVDRGKNEREMVRWNAIIKEELGIDNLEIYKPFDF